jgi:hypothetical protein
MTNNKEALQLQLDATQIRIVVVVVVLEIAKLQLDRLGGGALSARWGLRDVSDARSSKQHHLGDNFLLGLFSF